jgi:hypothetical protein
MHDLRGGAGLLPAEIVRRHADDHQPLVAIARPQLLQPGILGREAAERRGVDDQDRLARMLGEPQRGAVEALEGEGIGGDPADGGRLGLRHGGRRQGAGGEGENFRRSQRIAHLTSSAPFP